MNLLPTYLLIFTFLLSNSSVTVKESNDLPVFLDGPSSQVRLDQKLISADDVFQENCKFKDIPLYGKVKFVESFGDIKIKFVNSFPDIKVQFVTSFPKDCGKWQVVESFPDFTVQVVESFPDLKVETVDSFPGMK